MSLEVTAWRRSPLTWAGTLGGSTLFGFALFYWPYHFRVPEVISGSYYFGYSNRVGQIVVAVWLALLATLGPALPPRDASGKPLTRSTLRKAVLLTGLVASVLYLGTREVNGVNEAIYFIDRLHLTLAGHLPYKGQEFIYGAGMLYLPALLAWGLHLRVPDAYGLVYVCTAVLGVWLLYKTLCSAVEFPGARRSVFLLFTAANLLNLCSFGLNYSLFRFALPCYLATRVHRALIEGEARRAFLLPLPFYGLLLLWSPELGISFGVGMVAYLGVFGLRLRPGHWGAFAGLIAGLVALTLLAAWLHVFAGMVGFSHGGYNFPIIPSPFLFLFLLAAGLCAMYVGQAWRLGSRSVLPALIAGSCLSMAAALGRCDMAHVLTAPMGILLAGFLLVSGFRWPRRVVFTVAWLIMFLLPLRGVAAATVNLMAKAALPAFFGYEQRHGHAPQTTSADTYILDKMTTALGSRARAQEKFDDFQAFGRMRGTLNVAEVFGLPPRTPVYAPFGFAPGHQGTSHPPSLDEGYFLAMMDIVSAEDVERKIGEIEQEPKRPMVMLPNFREQCGTTGEDQRALLSGLNGHHYGAPVIHRLSMAVRVCAAIENDFHPAGAATARQFGYQLWLPNGR